MIDNSTLDRLIGKHVIGSDGEKIGKVSDVYESTDGGEGTFATVKTGLFGSGASFFPLQAAEFRDDEVLLPYDKDFVKGAPRVEDDQELTAPEELRLFSYYAGTSYSGTDGQGAAAGQDTSGLATDNAMTRSEEQLSVGTQQVEVGRARLRKYVVTGTETVDVPVSREEVRVEREPITDADRGGAMDGPAISEEEHEVVLSEERPVVNKETVPVERVRLSTETVTEQAQVSEETRKEKIDVETP